MQKIETFLLLNRHKVAQKINLKIKENKKQVITFKFFYFDNFSW